MMIIQGIIEVGYNIRSTWFLDIRISTCSKLCWLRCFENIFSKSYLLGSFQKFNLSKITHYTVLSYSCLANYTYYIFAGRLRMIMRKPGLCSLQQSVCIGWPVMQYGNVDGGIVELHHHTIFTRNISTYPFAFSK